MTTSSSPRLLFLFSLSSFVFSRFFLFPIMPCKRLHHVNIHCIHSDYVKQLKCHQNNNKQTFWNTHIIPTTTEESHGSGLLIEVVPDNKEIHVQNSLHGANDKVKQTTTSDGQGTIWHSIAGCICRSIVSGYISMTTVHMLVSKWLICYTVKAIIIIAPLWQEATFLYSKVSATM